VGGGICPLLGHIEGWWGGLGLAWSAGGVGAVGVLVWLYDWFSLKLGVLWGVSLLCSLWCYVGRCLGSWCTFALNVCFYLLVLSLLRIQCIVFVLLVSGRSGVHLSPVRVIYVILFAFRKVNFCF